MGCPRRTGRALIGGPVAVFGANRSADALLEVGLGGGACDFRIADPERR